MLVYQIESLEPIGYTDSDFQSDIDSRKYHLIRDIVNRGDMAVSQIASEDNLADPFTKGLSQKVFDQHVEGMGVKCIGTWL